MQRFVNNWRTELAGELLSAASVALVSEAMASLLAMDPGDFFDLTIDPDGGAEIIRVTSVSGGELAIDSRGREGTSTPASWPAGTVIACTVTAAFVEAIQTGGSGGGVDSGDGDPSEAPASLSGRYVDETSGAIWLASMVGGLGGPVLGWVKVWPAEVELDTPPLQVWDAGMIGSTPLALSAVTNTLIYAEVPSPEDTGSTELYLTSQTYLTVTSAADLVLSVQAGSVEYPLDGMSGCVRAAGVEYPFDLDTGTPTISVNLSPGVYLLALEAHVVIPEVGAGPVRLQGAISSGAAYRRRGLYQYLGPGA